MNKGLQHISRMIEYGHGKDEQFFRDLYLSAPGVLHSLMGTHKETLDYDITEMNIGSEVSILHQSPRGTVWFYIRDRKVIYHAATLDVELREVTRLAKRLTRSYCDEEYAVA